MHLHPHLIAATLASVVLCAPAHAGDALFSSLSFEQALEKARVEEKAVFIDFYTTWCGPCKQLDRMTWPDESVRASLHQHTVPLKIDAEKQTDLTRRYAVRACPTLIFIDSSGEEMDRIVGFRGPQAFINDARPILAGRTKQERVQEVVDEAKAAETQGHGKKTIRAADALVEAGRHEEALAMYLKVFDDPGPGMGGVRTSFLLASIVRLGRAYPPAIDALRERRDAAADRVVAGEGSRGDATDVIRINKDLGEEENTIAFARRAHEAQRTHLLDGVGDDLVGVFARAQEYELADQVVDLRRSVIQVFEWHDFFTKDTQTRFAGAPERDKLLRSSRERFAGQVADYYGVMLALGKQSDADRVARNLVRKHPDEIAVYNELAESADRAGSAAHAIQHVEAALERDGWSDERRAELERLLERTREAS